MSITPGAIGVVVGARRLATVGGRKSGNGQRAWEGVGRLAAR